MTVPVIQDADVARRQRAIIWFGGVLALSALALLVMAVVQGPEWPIVGVLGGIALVLGGVCAAAWRGHVRAAGLFLTLTVVVGVAVGQLVRQQVGFAPFFVAVSVVVASVVLKPRDVWVAIGCAVVAMVVMLVDSRTYAHRAEPPGTDFVHGFILLGILSSVAVLTATGVRRLLGDLTRHETEAERAREAARQAETQTRLIAEHTQDLIALVRLGRGVVWLSPSHQRVLGVPAGEVSADALHAFVHPEDLPVLQAAFAHLAAEPLRRQVRLKRADGEFGWFEALFSPVPQERLVVLTSRDVTEVRALSAQLEVSQKMEALGRLAGGVAHDFNNLLAVMQTCASLARGDLPPGSAAERDLDDLQGAIERATTLTRQLLAFSRREVVVPSRLDVGEVVTPVVDMAKRLLGRDVQVRLQVAPGAGPVRAAPSQLEQVVMNLALNARDAMPGGGVLTLEVGPARDEALGDVVALTVRDTGSGMSDETKARIFEPFFTTKPAGRGTGLGLATVYGVVRGLGGRIDVETALGRGTEFRVLLPRVPQGTEREGAPAASTAPPRAGVRVLVVDDEPAVRTMMVRILKARGLEVRDAGSGEEALRTLEGSWAPDALVTDVMLPGLDGVHVAEQFRQRLPVLRVVLVSGFTPDPSATARLVAAGATFLAKPFTPAQLVTAALGDAGKDGPEGGRAEQRRS